MKSPLASKQVAQIGIIVDDIESKARAWAELLGLPVPEIRMPLNDEITHAEYRGKPTTARGKFAFFHLGNVDLELIEPVGGPSTWKDQLDRHGNSLHHLAFRLRDLDEMMDKLPELQSEGLGLIQRGDWPYVYLDGVAQLGTIVELFVSR